MPYDLFFVTFGQEYNANVTPGMTVNRARAMPGDSVTFQVDFNNTGATAASRVWINDTLASALTNVSLTFPDLQPLSAASFPNLTFADVGNGPHAFTITGEVAFGTVPGTLLTNVAEAAFSNATDVVFPAGAASASVRVGLVTKQMYLGKSSGGAPLLTTTKPTASTPQTTSMTPGSAPVTFALSPPLAKPLHVWGASVALWVKSQKVPPQSYHLTLGLLDNAVSVASLSPAFQINASSFQPYTFTFAVSNYTFAPGDQVGLQIVNLGGGGGSTDALIVAYNATLNGSQLDVVTDTYVSIDALTLENQDGATSNWSPLDSLVVQANVSDPFGSSRIAGVWVNITDPSGQLAAAGAMTAVLTDPSGLAAWTLFAYTLAPPLAAGQYRVVVNAMEDNGVLALAQAWASVSTPSFTFETAVSARHVQQGEALTLSAFYNNTGTGSAGSVWINDTLPAGLAFVSSVPVATSVSGSTYTWALTGVGPGPHSLAMDLVVTTASVGWVENRATLEYTDESEHPLATVYSNQSIFLNGPIVSLAMTDAPAAAIHANESVTYTFSLTNSGAEAHLLWLNDTLPTGFRYASSTETGLGGTVAVAGSVVRFAFSAMASGATWQWDLVATAGPTLVLNASYENAASLDYTSLNDTLMPESTANLSLTALSPWFPWASVLFLNPQALAGAVAPADISFNNLGNEAASYVWINLTLDAHLTMTNASAPYAVSGTTVTFLQQGVGVGGHTIFLNVTVSPAATDLEALSLFGTLDPRDGFGNPLPTTVLVRATLFVHAAQMSVYVAPASPVMEVGVPYPFALSCYNWGLDTASNVWLNFTLPSNLLYVNDSSPSPPTVSGTDFSWHRTNMAPGSFSIDLYLKARLTTANGTQADLSFHVDAQGSNHVSLPGISKNVTALIVAPMLLLTITSTSDHLPSGGSGTLVYTLRLTNVGMATAESVFLVDTIDPRLQVLYYDAAVSAAEDNQTYNWTFSGLAPGATQTVNVTVQLAGEVPAGSVIPNAFEATYTNSAGLVLGRIRSNPVAVTVTSDLAVYGYLGIVAAALALAALVVLRRRKTEIEDVFLVYRDGVLISHLSRTILREKDEDVLSGMLTAVQEFVREAFQYGEHRDLHQMDFGDYRILIERGTYVFLAVVYSGRESAAIHRKVRSVIDRVETEFGTTLATWDGDMEQVMGARDLIRDTLLGSSNHNHAAKPVPDSD